MTLGPKQLRKAAAAMQRAYALKGTAYYPMDEWKRVAS